MARILRSPTKYVQGPGEFATIYQHLVELGSKIFFIATHSGLTRIRPSLEKCLQDTKILYQFSELQNECCEAEIQRLLQLVKSGDYDVVVGAGGGKVLDTAKAVAYFAKLPVAILPTVASTDAPCSALSVLYKENGEFDRYLFLPSSPNLVLVDTDIVAKAPVRLLVAGMGDALATYFEARAVAHSGKNNQVGGKPTIAGFLLAKQCYQTLLEDGVKAKCAVEAGCVTKAVENIIEVNTYLSGVGFESGGLGAAHAIQKGFTFIPELHSLYHGEKVAFGTIAQLILENAPVQEIEKVIDFCKQVGLPTTFEELGLQTVSREQLKRAAQMSCVPGSTIYNMPFEIVPDDVYNALLGADAMGRCC